jgi:putative 4-mercaptohistidine N1-methyltranferase
LDIGCATGRASFELSRYFDTVTAIDNSRQFIEIATRLQQHQHVAYHILEEGQRYSKHIARIPPEINAGKVHFRCGDAAELFKNHEAFNFVLAANLICRLTDPRAFLESIARIVNPKGVLALASPYSWLEEFTPRHKWLGTENISPFQEIQEILKPHFNLKRTFDLPFLIREHARKYQWGISQMSLWIKT